MSCPIHQPGDPDCSPSHGPGCAGLNGDPVRDAGVRRALGNVRTKAEALLAAVADAEAALDEHAEATTTNGAVTMRLPLAAADPVPDPLRTPSEIALLVDVARDSDGRWPWVRFVPSKRWRQVDTYSTPDPDHGRPEWALEYQTVDGADVELVEAHTTLPAYTAAEFDQACERERSMLDTEAQTQLTEVVGLHRDEAESLDDGPAAA